MEVSPERIKGLKRMLVEEVPEGDLPMGERLRLLELGEEEGSEKQLPQQKGEDNSKLLVQGLQSNDKNLLNTILFRADEMMVDTTVEHLKFEWVVPLMKQLNIMMNLKDPKNGAYTAWMKAVLYHHASYLSSHSEGKKLWQPFMDAAAEREQFLPQMMNLYARLDQLLTKCYRLHEEPLALLVYCDESTDESSSEDDECDDETADDIIEAAMSNLDHNGEFFE